MQFLRRHWALICLVALAAALRLIGIGWGLRHPPHVDEHYFVQYTGWMLAAGDLDHRFYEYPGLLFYMLAPVLAFFHPPEMGASAYLAARMLFALIGVLSVPLTHRLALPLAGPSGALLAAALVAVSPLEVRTAHMVRPDVVLEPFMLLALLALRRPSDGRRAEWTGGAAMGLALAVKFSAVLLAPCYLAQRICERRLRLAGTLAALIAATLTFVALSPYTIIHARDAWAGAAHQVAFHYETESQTSPGYAGMAASYGAAAKDALGWAGLFLVGAAAWLARREWRAWLPLAVLPLVTILVFSTADVRRLRFLVPCLGVLATLAGMAFARLVHGPRGLAVVAGLLVIAQPLTASALYVSRIRQPGARDAALDWILANVPPGSRVVTTLAGNIGIDPKQYEVVRLDRLEARTRPQAVHADVVVSGPSDQRSLVKEFTRLLRAEPANRVTGAPVFVLAPGTLRPSYRPVEAGLAQVSTSSNPERAGALLDGDLATTWHTNGAQGGQAWIEVAWPAPMRIDALELQMGIAPSSHNGRSIAVLVQEAGQWRRVPAWLVRAPVSRQPGDPKARSKFLALEPVTAQRLRLVLDEPQETPWEVAELRLWASGTSR